MKVKVDDRVHIGTAKQIVQQMRSLAWQPMQGANLGEYLAALRASLDGMGVKVEFEDGATINERCEVLLHAAIAGGLAEEVDLRNGATITTKGAN